MLLLGSDLSLTSYKKPPCEIEPSGYLDLQTFQDPKSFLLKAIMLGDYGVGKTTLAKTFYSAAHGHTDENTLPKTMYKGNMHINDEIVTLRLLDTAGEERFRSITASYFRGTNCCLLLFNTANKNSFTNIGTWYEDASRMISGFEDITVILIGINKKSQKREVTLEQCENFADFKDLPYVEIDLENKSSVLDVFKIIASNAVIKYKQESSLSSSLSTTSRSSSHSDSIIVRLTENAKGTLHVPGCTC